MNNAPSRLPASAPTVHLYWGEELLRLVWRDASGTLQERDLPLGLQRLARQLRISEPPSALALEAAIEQIEDAVMPLAASVPAAATLVLQSAQAPAGLRQALGGPAFDHASVENTFDRLARLAQGLPAPQAEVPESAVFALALLVVREALHHLRLRDGRWQTSSDSP